MFRLATAGPLALPLLILACSSGSAQARWFGASYNGTWPANKTDWPRNGTWGNRTWGTDWTWPQNKTWHSNYTWSGDIADKSPRSWDTPKPPRPASWSPRSSGAPRSLLGWAQGPWTANKTNGTWPANKTDWPRNGTWGHHWANRTWAVNWTWPQNKTWHSNNTWSGDNAGKSPRSWDTPRPPHPASWPPRTSSGPRSLLGWPQRPWSANKTNGTWPWPYNSVNGTWPFNKTNWARNGTQWANKPPCPSPAA